MKNPSMLFAPIDSCAAQGSAISGMTRWIDSRKSVLPTLLDEECESLRAWMDLSAPPVQLQLITMLLKVCDEASQRLIFEMANVTRNFHRSEVTHRYNLLQTHLLGLRM